MADSIRQQIMTAVIARMKQITKMYSHTTNLGSNIFEWRTTPFQETELPGMDIRDTNESITIVGQNNKYTLTIQIEAKARANTSANIMREMIADIIFEIGKDRSFGGLVINVTPVQNESVDFGQMDKKFCGVTITFELQYMTKAFDPFNLA